MSNQGSAPSFREELTSLARPGESAPRANRMRDARRAAIPASLLLVAAVPVVYLLLCLLLRGAGIEFSLAPWLIALISSLPAITFVVLRMRSASGRVAEAAALALIDDTMGLQDRLSSAREFLETAEPSPFMQAAIEDAKAHAERARSFQATAPEPVPTWSWRHLRGPALAAIALFASTLIDVRVAAAESTETSARNVWSSTVVEIDRHGGRARVRFSDPVPLVAEITEAAIADLSLDVGVDAWVSVKATEITVFAA